MFIAALFTIVKHLNVHQQMNRKNVIYIYIYIYNMYRYICIYMGILFNLKKEDPVICNNLKDIMLSKIIQTQEDKYCMILVIWGM